MVHGTRSTFWANPKNTVDVAAWRDRKHGQEEVATAEAARELSVVIQSSHVSCGCGLGPRRALANPEKNNLDTFSANLEGFLVTAKSR